jgi:hypothetical protein
MVKTKTATTATIEEVAQKSVSIAAPSLEESAKKMLRSYLNEEKVGLFSSIPEGIKLTLLQKTPQEFIKDRALPSGKIYHYVEHNYAKKALNFCFNFNASNKVVSKEYFTYTEKYKDYKDPRCQKDAQGKIIPIEKERVVTEAECLVEFTLKRENGDIVIRTVNSSHKGYTNPATTRGDIMQSAISKSWVKVAATFGIGAELEDDLYRTDEDKNSNTDFIDGEIMATPSSNKAFGTPNW